MQTLVSPGRFIYNSITVTFTGLDHQQSQNWQNKTRQFFEVSLAFMISNSLQWRHNGRDDVSNHQPHDCLLNRLFRRRSKRTSKLRITSLFVGNSPGTGEFPTQMASNAENVSIWWCHHVPFGHQMMYPKELVKSANVNLFFLVSLCQVRWDSNWWKTNDVLVWYYNWLTNLE